MGLFQSQGTGFILIFCWALKPGDYITLDFQLCISIRLLFPDQRKKPRTQIVQERTREAKGNFGKSLAQCGHCRGSVNKCFSVGYVCSRDYTDRPSLEGRCETDRKIFRNHQAPLWHRESVGIQRSLSG